MPFRKPSIRRAILLPRNNPLLHRNNFDLYTINVNRDFLPGIEGG